MTLVVALFALAIGWTGGVIAGSAHARGLHEENEGFRRALRYLRGVIGRHPELRHLARYIDNLLDDEAGA